MFDRSHPLLLALAILASGASIARAQLVTAGEHRIIQSDLGALIEEGDRFGYALASGDFDGDGAADLAIGSPSENVGAIVDAGYVLVAYGSRDGLEGATSRAPTQLHQDVAGVEDTAETSDAFGAALAAGDFDDDGYDDLAVGVPGEVLAAELVGAVQVFYGSAAGILIDGDHILFGSFLGDGGHLDRAGSALASCDRTGDGDDDLYVGIPGRDGGTGLVYVLEGGPTGLSTVGSTTFQPAELEEGDAFGARLACGDADGDGVTDLLAVARYGGTTSFGVASGEAHLLRSGGGPSILPALTAIDHETPGAVALARLHAGDPARTLLVGNPGDADAATDGGSVLVTGLGAGNWLTQEVDVLSESTEDHDLFGAAIAVGDFDHDGLDDVAFGVPGETFYDGAPGEIPEAGLVHVTYGSATLTGESGTAQTWSWESPLTFGALEGDRFGSVLATGDFDANGVDDLAIGLPEAVWGGAHAAGVVQILYAWPPGWIFGDDFESGRATKWSAVVP